MPTPNPQACPKCGRHTLNTTKTITFQIPDGETSLRMVLECSHCKRAVIQEPPPPPAAPSREAETPLL